MKVGLTGNVISGLAERRALEDDLKLATMVCTLLVGLAMFLYFRSAGPMLSSVLPAACGVVLALAIAQSAFGYLNAATAFMASIILGNGITTPSFRPHATKKSGTVARHQARFADVQRAALCRSSHGST